MNRWAAPLAFANSPESIALAAQESDKDELAFYAVKDYIEENQLQHNPFKIGDKIFFVTATLYYVGEVEELGFGWVKLKDASWVHWTGRLSSLIATGDLKRTHGDRKARSEYLGEVTVWLQGLIAHYPWKGILLKESV